MSGRRDDVLNLLAQARPDALDRPLRAERRANDLAVARTPHGAGKARTSGTGRARALRGAWLGAAATAALAAVPVIALAVLPPQPAGRPSPSQSGPTRSGQPAVPSGQLTARSLLLAAAEQSDATPARAGRYWRERDETVSTYLVGPPGDRYVVDVREVDTQWLARAPHATSVSTYRYLGAGPHGPADVAAWRRAGSPSAWTAHVVPEGKVWRVQAGARARQVHEFTAAHDIRALGSENVSFADLAALPDDPVELRRVLLDHYRDGTAADLPTDRRDWLFQVGANLVTGMPVSPAVVSAAYRMLADLDGVRATPGVHDAGGRVGVAVGVEQRLGGQVVERRIIVDPSGRPLGTDTVVRGTAPGTAKAGRFALPRGTVLTAHSIEAGWSDRARTPVGP